MTNQRFRPSNGGNSGNGGNRQPARVPVNRPVGRPQHQQPTQSFEREETQQNAYPQQGQQNQYQNQGFQEQPSQSRMNVPPMMDFEDEYMQEEGQKSKSNMMRNILIGFVSIAVIAGGLFAGTKLLGNDETPLVDGSQVTEGENTNPLSEKTPSPTGETTETVNFDGNPIPVKWPADVKPTRMEIQLDPHTGNPVLLLVGDKSGLGTVIRSYEQNGALSGYWVIVPDSQEGQATEEAAAQEGTQEGTQENQDQSNGQ